MRQKTLASQAEAHVAGILTTQGWRILARNYRWIGTEIDILATKGSSLIAVEVKFRTRFTHDMISVSELLPRRKMHSLKKGLRAAMCHLRISAPKTRIDLVIVTPQTDDVAKKIPPGNSPEGMIYKNDGFKVTWYPAVDA